MPSNKKNRTIIKLSNRKDCLQNLRAKKRLKSLEDTTFNLPSDTKIFINDSLCGCYRGLWNKCKRLKVVSATFLLVCFVRLKKSTCETRKNDFLFHFESSFRSWDNKILTLSNIKLHDVIKCANIKHETFYWINWEVKAVW